MGANTVFFALFFVSSLNTSNITSCESYGISGQSVCDDIILIEVSEEPETNSLWFLTQTTRPHSAKFKFLQVCL